MLCSASAASHAAGGSEIIGIDLGTTNSCVAVMEGKVTAAVYSSTVRLHLALAQLGWLHVGTDMRAAVIYSYVMPPYVPADPQGY